MTCGIYKLYYKNSPEVYIGKSINILNRFNQHINSLKNNTHKNKKLTALYAVYGAPQLNILEELPSNNDDILYIREKYWIEEYNSYLQGMNENEGGRGSGHGETHNQAKYNNNIYIDILRYLCKQPPLPLKEIANLTGASISVVANISKQNCHFWMKEEHPDLWEEYTKIRNRGYRRIATNAKAGTNYTSPVLISPEGLEFIVERTTLFAREHGLSAGNLANVINGKRKTHKGWKLKQNDRTN